MFFFMSTTKNDNKLKNKLNNKLNNKPNRLNIKQLLAIYNDIEQIRTIAEKEAEELKAAANKEAEDLIAAANKNIDNMKVVANKEIEDLKTTANKEIEDLKTTANKESNTLKLSAKQKADELLINAKNDADGIIKSANEKKQEINNKAEADKKKTIASAESKKQEIINNANLQADGIINDAKRSVDQVKSVALNKMLVRARKLTCEVIGEDNRNIKQAANEKLDNIQEIVQDSLQRIISLRDELADGYIKKQVKQLIELYNLVNDGYFSHLSLLEQNKTSNYRNCVQNMQDYLFFIADILSEFGVTEILTEPGEPFSGKHHEPFNNKNNFDAKISYIEKSVRGGFKLNDIVIQKERVLLQNKKISQSIKN